MTFQIFIFVLIFVGVILIVEGIYLLIFGQSIKSNRALNRRMTLLDQGQERETVLNKLRKERDQHRRSLKMPLLSIFSKKAAQANIAFSPQALFLVMLLVTILSFIMLSLFSNASSQISAFISVVIGIGGVYYWLNKKAKNRISLFEEQLPDAVDLIVRSLRVGHPFSSSINIVATEMPDPIGTEFGIIADEITYGMDVSKALSDLSERINLADVHFFAVSVSIQAQSGGNLAEILEGLAKIIRSRFKLFRRVRAITAEAKWSGMFLSLFPLGALAVINLINPTYYDAVKDSAAYVPAILFLVIMLGINIIVMRAMVNIKV